MSQISAYPVRFPPNPRAPARGKAAASMDLFLFKLTGERRYGLTRDPVGRNLPAGFRRGGGWIFVRRFDVLPHELRADFDADDVAAAVAKDGYSLIACPFNAD